jgi:hypothetical protein
VPSVYTVDGIKPAKKRKGAGAKMAVGECKRVITGRTKNCTIEFCRTGRGKTGYEFKKGTRRCGR